MAGLKRFEKEGLLDDVLTAANATLKLYKGCEPIKIVGSSHKGVITLCFLLKAKVGVKVWAFNKYNTFMNVPLPRKETPVVYDESEAKWFLGAK